MHTEGDGKVEQLAAKFKTPELAEAFRQAFTDCQSRMSQTDATQTSAAEALSRDSNPVVFFDIAVDDEHAGRIVDGALRSHRAQNGGELPCSVYRREGLSVTAGPSSTGSSRTSCVR